MPKKNNNNNGKISEEPYAGFLKQCKFNRFIVFYIVLIIHFLWGAAILYADRPLRHAPPLKHIFDDIHSTHFVAWLFIGTSLMALFAITRDFRKIFARVICLLPQQALLLWTCLSAIAVSKTLSDFVTELPLFTLAIAHTLALIVNFVFIPVMLKKR